MQDVRSTFFARIPHLSQGRVLLLALLSLAVLLALFVWQTWSNTRTSVDLELSHINGVVTQNSLALQRKRYESLKAVGQKLLAYSEDERHEKGRQFMNAVVDISTGLVGMSFLTADLKQDMFAAGSGAMLNAHPDVTRFQDPIERAIARNNMVSAAPVWDSRSGEWLLPLFVPLIDERSNALQGVVAAWIRLQERVEGWQNLDLGQDTSIAVIGDDGVPRYLSPDFSAFANPAGRALFTALKEGVDASGRPEGWLDGDFVTQDAEPVRFRVHFAVIGPGMTSLVMRPYSQYHRALMVRVQPAVWLFVVLSLITIIVHLVVSAQQHRYRKRLAFETHHDPLTGLLNRSYLLQRMNHSMAYGPAEPMTLVLINLDHFNRVNDQHGHAVGDAVLQQVPLRLQSVLAANDLMARHSGDEFMLVLRDADSIRGEDMLVMAMQAALQEPFEIGSRTIRLNASIGVAHFPQDGSSAEDLLGKADAALHKAKAEGRGKILSYCSSIAQAMQREKLLENQLAGCCLRNEIRVHYQPQVNCRTGELTGAEALVRWNNPLLGNVSPSEFIPLAEKMGLIADIDRHVMREACGFIQRLSELCQKPLRISVNLSAAHLLNSGLLDDIRQLIRQFALEPKQLVLEITETAMLNDFERAAQQVHQLRALGVGISVDDFGTGYSSLAYIHRLPVTEIKIDRSFVDQITSDLHDRALTSAIIAMGKRLHLEVVAEGVEEESQWKILSDQHCDTIQGYHVARPMTGENFIRYALSDARGEAELQAVASLI
ncbi:putative bifunctional diguanylate cyclase/phosphodiesterase [Thalassolituus sp. LLYu03]|uniref:putative bifunctional diguanylate cyclase/phosphodiesterase n=1 Tax=Thalassolituus sp. LLYu03 TaxID=3421656 RepID=UPI003D2BFEB6